MTDWGRMTPVDEAALDAHRERMASLRLARGQAAVPKGGYVHHVDGDPTNSEIANLVVVPRTTGVASDVPEPRGD